MAFYSLHWTTESKIMPAQDHCRLDSRPQSTAENWYRGKNGYPASFDFNFRYFGYIKAWKVAKYVLIP
jgi:hypothetical protein